MRNCMNKAAVMKFKTKTPHYRQNDKNDQTKSFINFQSRSFLVFWAQFPLKNKKLFNQLF